MGHIGRGGGCYPCGSILSDCSSTTQSVGSCQFRE